MGGVTPSGVQPRLEVAALYEMENQVPHLFAVPEPLPLDPEVTEPLMEQGLLVPGAVGLGQHQDPLGIEGLALGHAVSHPSAGVADLHRPVRLGLHEIDGGRADGRADDHARDLTSAEVRSGSSQYFGWGQGDHPLRVEPAIHQNPQGHADVGLVGVEGRP